jgi:hypothetical protein
MVVAKAGLLGSASLNAVLARSIQAGLVSDLERPIWEMFERLAAMADRLGQCCAAQCDELH